MVQANTQKTSPFCILRTHRACWYLSWSIILQTLSKHHLGKNWVTASHTPSGHTTEQHAQSILTSACTSSQQTFFLILTHEQRAQNSKRPNPCKMKLEVISQTSKHELKPVFIGFCTSKVSGNGGYYASVLGFHFFWDRKQGILF